MRQTPVDTNGAVPISAAAAGATALESGSAATSTPASGKAILPEQDPRTKPYRDG